MTPTLSSLSVTLDLPLKPHQIPVFRGAVAMAAGWEHDLFHNHAPSLVSPAEEALPLTSPTTAGATQTLKTKAGTVTLKDRLLYRYPLIHYRSCGGKAHIFAINEGAQAIRQWLFLGQGSLQMDGTTVPYLIEHMAEQRHTLSLTEQLQSYRLLDYLALNDANYRAWQKAPDLITRMQILQGALTGHLLGLCTTFGYQVPNRQLQVELMDIRGHRPVKLHGGSRMAFGLIYRSNLLLPPGMALGRGVAFGYGRNTRTREGS